MTTVLNYEQISKNKWFILAIVLIVLGFVWFQLRPSLIRQSCQEKAREMGDTYFSLEFIQNEDALKKSQLQQEYMEKAYNRCLNDKGLE